MGAVAAATEHAGGFWDHRGLILFAAVGAAVEAGVLSAVAPAARPLAPQVTALAPIGAYHDLRWLFGYHTSWLGFAAGLGLLVLARSAVNTVLVRLAWPRAAPKPRPARIFGSNVALMVLAVALISPIVALVFGVALLPFSWPFLPAVPAMILIAAPLSHGGLMSSWWRTLPPWRAVAWVLADFLSLSAASAVIALLPAAGAVPAAALAGLINARAWFGVTSAVARPRHGRVPMTAGSSSGAAAGRAARFWLVVGLRRVIRWAPLAPLAAVMVLVMSAGVSGGVFEAAAAQAQQAGTTQPAGLAGTAGPTATTGPAGLTAQIPGSAETAADADGNGPGNAPAGRPRTAPAVLLVEGFGSPCCSQASGLQQAEPDSIVQQFSYRGLDAAGNPIPHGRAASDLPLPLLGDRLAAQVSRLHQETGKPVDLVAESEGTLGVDALLTRHPGTPVGSIVLASPIVAPEQASFPPGDRDGRGVASGYALHAVARLIGRLSPYGPSGAATLIDSVSSVGARYALQATRPGTVRWLAVIPLADAVTLPACVLPGNVAVVAGFHGGMLGKPGVQQMVHSFLAGHQVYGRQQLKDGSEILAATGAGWRMPDIDQPSPPCGG